MNGLGYSQLGLYGGLADAAKTAFSDNRQFLWTCPVGNAARQGRKMECFLVPVDFSEASLKGARQALELAKNQPAKVILLHVIALKLNWPATGPVNAPKLRQEMWAEAEEKLLAVAKKMSLSGVSVQPVITEGVPAEVISSQARENGATLIVIGRSTEKNRWPPFRRHTARRVMECAPCPVLAVP